MTKVRFGSFSNFTSCVIQQGAERNVWNLSVGILVTGNTRSMIPGQDKTRSGVFYVLSDAENGKQEEMVQTEFGRVELS